MAFQSKLAFCVLAAVLLIAALFIYSTRNEQRPTAVADRVISPGEELVRSKGCVACHSSNGQPGVGPTFRGLFGKTEAFADGSTQTVDVAYLAESIRRPADKIVRNYQPVMPAVPLTDGELQAIVDYIQSLK